MQIRMQKCETYVKRPKSEPPIKWVSSRNISSGYYNRDYPVDLSIVGVFLLSGLKKQFGVTSCNLQLYVYYY